MKKPNAADFRDSPREGASGAFEIGGEPLLCETCDRTCERFSDAALRGEEIAIQTSRQVLNPKSRGNVAELRTLRARGANPYPGCEHCTNDHLRAAACHGAYYLARRLRRR